MVCQQFLVCCACKTRFEAASERTLLLFRNACGFFLGDTGPSSSIYLSKKVIAKSPIIGKDPVSVLDEPERTTEKEKRQEIYALTRRVTLFSARFTNGAQ